LISVQTFLVRFFSDMFPSSSNCLTFVGTLGYEGAKTTHAGELSKYSFISTEELSIVPTYSIAVVHRVGDILDCGNPYLVTIYSP